MTRPQTEDATTRRTSHLANLPFACLLLAALLGGFCYYLDEYGHGVFRSIGEKPDYRAEEQFEDWCMWLAAASAAIGILMSLLGLVLIRRSVVPLKGTYRSGLGLALNVLTLFAILFAMFVRALANAA